MLIARHMVLFGMVLLTLSCYREEIDLESEAVVFNLSVSPKVRDFILESRDTSYSVEDPGISLSFNDEIVKLREIRTRGESALRFQRKSFSVFLEEPIVIPGREGKDARSFSRFKLVALTMDYTYIENRIGFGILEEVGVMPLFYRFVEFRINEETQGIYLLVEDPETYFEDVGSEFILRRGYDHRMEDAEYESSGYFTREAYETRFREIYSILRQHQGEELYEQLSHRLNLEQYFRKMGIDFLLQNGDYTDEIYLYAMIRDGQIQYRIIPWDYDDLFQQKPHEVGVSWGTGTIYGRRRYETIEDIYNEIGDKMIFSIEDDLDYTIARDSFLYTRYEKSLLTVVSELEAAGFQSLFGKIKNELAPLYSLNEVVAQSQYDRDSTSRQLWENNMIEKQLFLEQRLAFIKNNLNTP
ncbi:MAG: hypothetical protein GY790_00750 [Bacteroidetes bacterium]|nr:hypothetical protein [Bacteroidota bacterium]